MVLFMAFLEVLYCELGCMANKNMPRADAWKQKQNKEEQMHCCDILST